MDVVSVWIAPALGFAAAVLSGVFAFATRRSEQRFIAEQAAARELAALEERRNDVLKRSIEPLLYAASDLQSRIYNIVALGFLEKYGNHPTERWRRNTVEYTCFLFAQYFGWAESIRQAALFKESVDLLPSNRLSSRDDAALSIAASIREVSDVLRTDSPEFGEDFMLFAGDQHAIGELMFRWDEVGGERVPTVMRFATFTAEFVEPAFRAWFEPIIDALSSGLTPRAIARLSTAQGLLVDLMELLDPDRAIYKARKKLNGAGEHIAQDNHLPAT